MDEESGTRRAFPRHARRIPREGNDVTLFSRPRNRVVFVRVRYG